MNITEYLKNKFENKKCQVLGFARSNKPLAEMLISAGAYVTVRDKNEKVLDDDFARSLAEKGARFVVGERYLECLDGDFIFRSPGFRHDLPEIKSAAERPRQFI